jgi:hypothetical protein
MPEWLQWTTLAVGTGGPLGTAALLIKARSEARKTGADTTGVIVGASGDVIKQQREAIASLVADVKELKRKDRERDVLEEQHEMLLRRHSWWDRTVVEELRGRGVVLPDPPPLWPATG